MRATRDGGRLATIAGDPPAPRRGIAVTPVVVAPDGARLRLLAGWLAEGTISITVGGRYPLEQAGEALAQARRPARRGHGPPARRTAPARSERGSR